LRRVATACAFFGTSTSPRTMARSTLFSASASALAVAPSVWIGRSRTKLLCCAKACVSACTTLRSSLLAGPTAIFSVTGRIAK